MQNTLYIDSPEALESLCQQLRDVNSLALDTEFIREKTYYAKLCLIQIATDELVACIDPLRLDNLDSLFEILYDPNKVKILHAARQDLEIFNDLKGAVPGPIFDTQIAATLLGFQDQVGYGKLVHDMLGIELDKAHARTDWSQRPLDEAQLQYAADDVRYLLQLYPIIRQQLQSHNRLDWLDEDFTALEDPALYEVPTETAWKRVSGHGRLKGPQLAILRQLAGWREQRAKTSNRPRRWILNDDALITLAQRAPMDSSQLTKIRALPENCVKQYADDILNEIKAGKALPKELWPSVKHKRPTQEQEALTDLLMACLRQQAVQNNISPAIIGTRKDLEKLATGTRDLPILHGWRGHIAGESLLALLDGKLCLHVKQSTVLTTPLSQ